MSQATTMPESGRGSAVPAGTSRAPRRRHWPVQDLIVIGIFAAVVKIASMAVALLGGGMNPLTLLLKNAIYTTLLLVLLHKVRRFGTLTLFITVSSIVSLLLLGSGVILLPAALAAGIVAEAAIMALGGYGRSPNLFVGVILYDLLSKCVSLGMSWVVMREQPAMISTVVLLVALGYAGSLLGLLGGFLFVKELRHAGIVRQ